MTDQQPVPDPDRPEPQEISSEDVDRYIDLWCRGWTAGYLSASTSAMATVINDPAQLQAAAERTMIRANRFVKAMLADPAPRSIITDAIDEWFHKTCSCAPGDMQLNPAQPLAVKFGPVDPRAHS